MWRLTPSGALDRTFGVSGAVTIARDVQVHHARVDTQGRLLIAGDGRSADDMPVLVALRVGARALDTSYGVRGVATTDITYEGAIAFDRAGAFVAAGPESTRDGEGVLIVERFDPSGRADTTFGEAGRRSLPTVGVAGDTSVGLLADGSTVLSMRKRSSATVVRLDPSGTPTTHLGPAGMRSVPPGLHLVTRPDGRFLLRDAKHVRQYRADGSPDTSFGRAGLGSVPVGGLGFPGPPVLQPDGALLVPLTVPERVPGIGMDPNGWDVALVRLRPDGVADARFGARGRATLRVPLNQQSAGGMQNIAVRRDGTIVGAWKSSRPGSESPNALRWLGVVVGGFR